MSAEWFEIRPVCFDRYVVDVPKILEPVVTEARLEGFSVANLGPKRQADLNAKIAERRGLMLAGGPVDSIDLVTFQGASQEKSTTILAYDAASSFDKELIPSQHRAEIYLLAEGHLFEMRGMIRKNRRDAQLARRFRIAHAVRPRGAEDVPTKQGYCFQNGFVELSNVSSDFFEISMRNERIDGNFAFFIDVRNGAKLIKNEYNWPPEATERTVAGFDGIQTWGVVTEGGPDFRGYAGEFYSYHASTTDQSYSALQIRTEQNATTKSHILVIFPFVQHRDFGTSFWNH